MESGVVAVWRFGASVPRSRGELVGAFGVLVCHRRSHPHDSVQIRSPRGITFSLFGCARTVRISQVKTTKTTVGQFVERIPDVCAAVRALSSRSFEALAQCVRPPPNESRNLE